MVSSCDWCHQLIDYYLINSQYILHVFPVLARIRRYVFIVITLYLSFYRALTTSFCPDYFINTTTELEAK